VSPTPTYVQPQPSRSGLMTALVAGAIIALVAANIYLYVQIDHVRTDLANMHDRLMTELTNLRDASTVTTASQTRHLDALKDELRAAREQVRTASSQAKADAQAYADRVAKQLEAEQAKQQQQFSGEISDVKQSTTQANAKIADVSTDLGTVKSQATQTQAQLEKTINDLKSVTGDLGVQSGLIATNGKELQALKLKGERNYIDIKLGKTKTPQRFGDITLKLLSVNPKKNKYSIDVMADDKLYEKRDKNTNEPVQFYTGKGGHTPYELVINQVSKDQIVGYLATPKDTSR
jgi:predicted  nucleic acid-binding Zn-ribbon protein